MTIADMHRGVRTQFEQVASHTLDNFLPQEVDHYLNRATEDYVDGQRALLLSAEEQVRSREANENLRTLIESEKVTSFTSLSDYGPGAVRLSLSALGSPYAYYLKGRLKDSNGDFYTLRKVSLEAWHEHAPTKHNVPIFRRPVLYEQGDSLWILVPSTSGSVSEVLLTYLTPPASLSSELAVTITVSEDANSTAPAYIAINGTQYEVVWNTDLSTTLSDFVGTNAPAIWDNHEVRLEKGGGAGELVFTTSAFYVDPNSFATTDGTVTFSTATSQARVDSDLPPTTHQDLVDHTVNLLRRDLPPPQSAE